MYKPTATQLSTIAWIQNEGWKFDWVKSIELKGVVFTKEDSTDFYYFNEKGDICLNPVFPESHFETTTYA